MRPPVEVRIFARMVAFAQSVQRGAEAALAGRSVTPAQFYVLSTLARRGELKQSDIASRLGVTAANVSQLVGKLVDAKLVRRTAQGTSKLVALTARGQALVDELEPEHEAFLAQQFEGLCAAERKQLLELLERLVEGAPAP